MTSPQIVAIDPGSPAERAGLVPGDEIVTIGGEVARDIIRWQLLTDAAEVDLAVMRDGEELDLTVTKRDGEPLGAEVHAAIFDRVQTCDNHCEFCFIYQLPKGMRRSLYLKDDDYRLSFLYGNFTTLTRFTELDLERVIDERLSPLYVSIHATDPDVRADILQNRRGAVSLRWLRALLDHGVEVHGQVVICPGVNDGGVLEDTLAGVLDRFPELASVCVVPLGVSKFNRQERMRPHTAAEARRVLDTIRDWQDVFESAIGRVMVHAADEYYLLAAVAFPDASMYGDFSMHEDGIGMARSFQMEFDGLVERSHDGRAGFFAWVDGAPADGYRAPRTGSPAESVRCADSGAPSVAVSLRPSRRAPIGILTGELGALVIEPLLAGVDPDGARVIPVRNDFFGGNIGVTGLMVGADLARVLASEPEGHRYLLPDVCLSRGRFLDGLGPDDLPRAVEIVPTDGGALRAAIDAAST